MTLNAKLLSALILLGGASNSMCDFDGNKSSSFLSGISEIFGDIKRGAGNLLKDMTTSSEALGGVVIQDTKKAASITADAATNTNWLDKAKTAMSNGKNTITTGVANGWEFTADKCRTGAEFTTSKCRAGVKFTGEKLNTGKEFVFTKASNGLAFVREHKVATGVTACAIAAASIALYVYLNQDDLFDKKNKDNN